MKEDETDITPENRPALTERWERVGDAIVDVGKQSCYFRFKGLLHVKTVAIVIGATFAFDQSVEDMRTTTAKCFEVTVLPQ